jgi:hypothetical protein
MKMPRIFWFVCSAAVVVFLWSLIQRVAYTPSRVIVERDVSDIMTSDPTKVTVSYDPYFVRENYFPRIILADGRSAGQTK